MAKGQVQRNGPVTRSKSSGVPPRQIGTAGQRRGRGRMALESQPSTDAAEKIEEESETAVQNTIMEPSETTGNDVEIGHKEVSALDEGADTPPPTPEKQRVDEELHSPIESMEQFEESYEQCVDGSCRQRCQHGHEFRPCACGKDDGDVERALNNLGVKIRDALVAPYKELRLLKLSAMAKQAQYVRDPEVAANLDRISSDVESLRRQIGDAGRLERQLQFDVKMNDTKVSDCQELEKKVRNGIASHQDSALLIRQDAARLQTSIRQLNETLNGVTASVVEMERLRDTIAAMEKRMVEEKTALDDSISHVRDEIEAVKEELHSKPPPKPKRNVWVLSSEEYLCHMAEVICFIQQALGNGCKVRGDQILPQEYDVDDLLIVVGIQTSTRIDMNFDSVKRELGSRVPNHMVLLVVQRSGSDKPAGSIAKVDPSTVPFESNVFRGTPNCRTALLQVVVGYSTYRPHRLDVCSVNKSTAAQCKLIALWLDMDEGRETA